jgi:peptide deformylase
MAVRPIVKLGDPVLRRKAKKIHRVDNYVKSLIDDLIDTVIDAPGSGLAAPQIGIPLRALVTYVDDDIKVLLNPEIVELSGEDVVRDEGCLSIPGLYGPVVRKEQLIIRGLSRTGKPVKIKTEGWEARAFQHEVDHLDGILFTDHVTDKKRLYEAQPEEVEDEEDEAAAI